MCDCYAGVAGKICVLLRCSVMNRGLKPECSARCSCSDSDSETLKLCCSYSEAKYLVECKMEIYFGVH